MKKYIRFTVDDIVVSEKKAELLPKYLQVFGEGEQLLCSLQICFNGYEDKEGNELEPYHIEFENYKQELNNE